MTPFLSAPPSPLSTSASFSASFLAPIASPFLASASSSFSTSTSLLPFLQPIFFSASAPSPFLPSMLLARFAMATLPKCTQIVPRFKIILHSWRSLPLFQLVSFTFIFPASAPSLSVISVLPVPFSFSSPAPPGMYVTGKPSKQNLNEVLKF